MRMLWRSAAVGVLAAALAAADAPPQQPSIFEHTDRDTSLPPRAYWPTQGWRHATPASQGMNATLLAEAVEFVRLFNMGGGRRVLDRVQTGTRWAIDRHADAMLVVKGG